MSRIRRIACLTLLAQAELSGVGCNLPRGPLEWDVLPLEPDLEHIELRLAQALETYDAVALEGLYTSFRIGDRVYHHDYVRRCLKLDQHPERVSDGTGLLATLERHLVSQAAQQLRSEIEGKQILFFSGLNRYGSADVMRAYSKRMLFGDMLYGFRLGIPIYSFGAFVSTARRLARTVARTPAHWFWPSARRHPPIMPRFQRFIRQADVIVGGISYFQRFMPATLEGKVIFTDVHNEAEVELFAERGARYLVSLTPVIDGVYVPLPVLEAALKLDAGARITGEVEDYYLGRLHELGLKPHIIDLAPEGSEDLALVALPRHPPQLVEPAPCEDIELSAAEDVGRFCFVIHPLSMDHVARLKIIRLVRSFVPTRFIEDAMAQLKPWPIGAVRNLTSKTGARAEGLIYAVPMTSKAIMRFPPEFLYKRLLQVAEDAHRRGCRLMGLGAFTSVAGDAGVTVSRRSPIGVTSGNSYTVAATLLTLERAALRCGIDIDSGRLLIIGATGSIGSICARIAAERVGHLYLVSPRPERLLEFSRQLEQEHPRLAGRIELSSRARDFVPLADGIITTTSSVDAVVDVDQLSPGCLVLDVARPPDIKPEDAARRGDVLVIESGEIKLLPGADVTYDIGLPPGLIYACLAETMLLALEKRYRHYTLGREIQVQQVNEMAELAEKHGFELADIRSFDRVVPDEHFARLAGINAERFAKADDASA